MKKFLSLLLFISFSIKGDIPRPTSKTIESFTETFTSLGKENGVMSPVNASFINERINDLVYYKNYYKACDKSKLRSFIVMGLFTIPLMAKIYSETRSAVNQDLEAVNHKREEIENRIKAREAQEKEKKEDADKDKATNDEDEKELAKLPSKKNVIAKAIAKVFFDSILSILTDPFSIKSSLTIIALGGASAYYYKNYRDYAGEKFRNINSLLMLLMKEFQEKAGILKSKMPAPDIMQKAGVIDTQVKAIVDRYEINNNLKKKVISFLQMLINFIKE